MSTRLILIALAALCSGLAGAPEARAGTRHGPTERRVIALVNDVRARHGLRALHASRSLSRAADRHSRDMLRRDFFDHSSSDGTPWDDRVRRFARSPRVGETLASVGGRGDGAARRVVRMWLESPPHRAVLLTDDYRRIGVGRRKGLIGRARATVYTADFAARR